MYYKFDMKEYAYLLTHTKIISAFLLVFILMSGAKGQSDLDFLFDDANVYRENRFGYSIGSPMLFDPWVIGKVYSNTGEIYYPMLVNYNVKEKEWEARNENKIISLDPTYFWCIVLRVKDNLFVDKSTGDSLLFVRGLLLNDENEYAQVLYNGSNIKLLKIFEVNNTKTTDNGNGGFTLNRFLHRSRYYIISDTKHERTGLTINDITKAYGKKGKVIKKYFEDNQLNPKGEKEWIDALKTIEIEFFQPLK
jgi:hypothetical protein